MFAFWTYYGKDYHDHVGGTEVLSRTTWAKSLTCADVHTFQLGVLVAFDRELRDAFDELFKVYFSIPILVEYLNHSLDKWVLM